MVDVSADRQSLVWYRFDPASLEILRQLGQIISSQDDMLRLVRSITTPQAKYNDQPLSTPSAPQIHDDTLDWDAEGEIQQQLEAGAYDWFGQPQPDSASTTPAASTSVAAVRWFGLLASHDPLVSSAIEHTDDTAGTEAGFLDLFNGQNEDDMTPLQRATKIIDGQPPEGHLFDEEEAMWKAPANIPLLGPEQGLFEHFLHRICSWVRYHYSMPSIRRHPLTNNSSISLTSLDISPPVFLTSPSATQAS